MTTTDTKPFTLHLGDCIEVMRTLPDNSVDSIVTDPPYELSNDGKQSAARVFLEFAFPQNAKLEPHFSGGCELAGLVGEILGLARRGNIPCPSATMPVVPMALNDDASLRQKQIKDASECAIGVSSDGASGDVESNESKYLGCFALKLADTAKMLQVLNEVGTGFVSRGIGIGFVGGAARFPSLLHSLGSVVCLDDHIGVLDHTLSDLVCAVAGAASGSVLRFDLAGGAVEKFSATGALLLTAAFVSGGAQLVRAGSTASSLPSMLETRRVCIVDGSTNRAISFDLIVHSQSVASIGFMGKQWDGSKIAYNVDVWREALRVLKPGGHLLAFSGSRTYHRMTCAIEDAGFEVRDRIRFECSAATKYDALMDSLTPDQRGSVLELLNDQIGLGSEIAWEYASGFPKSLNVSKAIDKAAGAEREVLSEGKAVKRMITGADQNANGSWIKDNGREYVPTVTAPATDADRQWEGWGTALKPAHEPICVARKPLIGTVAANVLAYGTGALNIDGCRVPTSESDDIHAKNPNTKGGFGHAGASVYGDSNGAPAYDPTAGRWPANICHDGSDEVVALFPDSNGSGPARKLKRSARADDGWGMNTTGADEASLRNSGTGSAARFFYCAKTSRADRNEGLGDTGPQFKHGTTLRDMENAAASGDLKGNTHPTVKPTDLMAYLCRLVTPPNGVVLDPFMGSGSTGKAAIREGFRFIGIDMTPEYHAIAEARINHELSKAIKQASKPVDAQQDLFS